MWVGKLENLSECPCLSKDAIARVTEFLKNNDMPSLENGSYKTGGEDYVNVFEYDTKESDGVFEKHVKFIDIHYPITGKETVLWANDYSRKTTPYDEDRDCSFGSVSEPEAIALDGTVCVFLPDEPHKAGVCLGESLHVKKAVFKIKA